MKLIKTLNFAKAIIIVLLALEIFGFFYFEISPLLRVLIIFLGLISLWQMKKLPEILVLLVLYLGLFDFYNIRYGLAIPTAIILLGICALVSLLYYFSARIYKFEETLEKNISLIYMVTTSLITLEIFLAITLWPVDPKTKSLIIVVAFYLVMRLIYLNVHHVLNLKRALGFVAASILIMAVVVSLGWWFGF